MLNHPHDCPVCDEGGQCLLQDETVSGGHGRRRYPGKKRTYRDQYLGPYIQHEMNRCIHCYRCSRFYQEYTGYRDLGPMQIGDRLYFGRFSRRRARKPLFGKPRGYLPDRRLHGQDRPVQGAAVGPPARALSLHPLLAWVQHHRKRPLPGGNAGRGAVQPGRERLLYLRCGQSSASPIQTAAPITGSGHGRLESRGVKAAAQSALTRARESLNRLAQQYGAQTVAALGFGSNSPRDPVHAYAVVQDAGLARPPVFFRSGKTSKSALLH